MAWPDNLLNVRCEGFPNKLLPVIKEAVENEKVKWIPACSRLFVDLGSGQFEFANCVWKIEEMREMVICVYLIEGNPNTEDLTLAVLRG